MTPELDGSEETRQVAELVSAARSERHKMERELTLVREVFEANARLRDLIDELEDEAGRRANISGRG